MTSQAAALRKARAECYQFQQGRDWIVSTYRPDQRATSHSHAMDFWRARNAVLETRLAIALDALGYPNDDVIYLSSKYAGADFSGAVDERLRLAVKVSAPSARR